jgi:hypothetical protein
MHIARSPASRAAGLRDVLSSCHGCQRGVVILRSFVSKSLLRIQKIRGLRDIFSHRPLACNPLIILPSMANSRLCTRRT